MNKALEALKQFRYSQYQGVNVYGDELLDIVENGLKEVSEEDRVVIKHIKSGRLHLLTAKRHQNLLKKQKALEIIKEKEMLSVFKDINGKCFLVFNTTAIEIPQEEYDLLKEVFIK